ncbi:hypothetical protein C8Q77DRAFT_929040 [Trametes polyzona]|nr:hypothetical protein C8Q77DRAFT_929040 [Trametes polyzona]
MPLNQQLNNTLSSRVEKTPASPREQYVALPAAAARFGQRIFASKIDYLKRVKENLDPDRRQRPIGSIKSRIANWEARSTVETVEDAPRPAARRAAFAAADLPVVSSTSVQPQVEIKKPEACLSPVQVGVGIKQSIRSQEEGDKAIGDVLERMYGQWHAKAAAGAQEAVVNKARTEEAQDAATPESSDTGDADLSVHCVPEGPSEAKQVEDRQAPAVLEQDVSFVKAASVATDVDVSELKDAVMVSPAQEDQSAAGVASSEDPIARCQVVEAGPAHSPDMPPSAPGVPSFSMADLDVDSQLATEEVEQISTTQIELGQAYSFSSDEVCDIPVQAQHLPIIPVPEPMLSSSQRVLYERDFKPESFHTGDASAMGAAHSHVPDKQPESDAALVVPAPCKDDSASPATPALPEGTPAILVSIKPTTSATDTNLHITAAKHTSFCVPCPSLPSQVEGEDAMRFSTRRKADAAANDKCCIDVVVKSEGTDHSGIVPSSHHLYHGLDETSHEEGAGDAAVAESGSDSSFFTAAETFSEDLHTCSADTPPTPTIILAPEEGTMPTPCTSAASDFASDPVTAQPPTSLYPLSSTPPSASLERLYDLQSTHASTQSIRGLQDMTPYITAQDFFDDLSDRDWTEPPRDPFEEVWLFAIALHYAKRTVSTELPKVITRSDSDRAIRGPCHGLRERVNVCVFAEGVPESEPEPRICGQALGDGTGRGPAETDAPRSESSIDLFLEPWTPSESGISTPPTSPLTPFSAVEDFIFDIPIFVSDNEDDDEYFRTLATDTLSLADAGPDGLEGATKAAREAFCEQWARPSGADLASCFERWDDAPTGLGIFVGEYPEPVAQGPLSGI